MRHSELVVPAYACAWSGSPTVTATSVIEAPAAPAAKSIARIRRIWLAMACASKGMGPLDLPRATYAGQAPPVHSGA